MNALERSNKDTLLRWAAYVHDTNYEFGDEADEVERVLKRIARSPKSTATMLTVYSTADVYRRYYAGYEGRRTLLDELYEKANNILAKTLKR